MDILARFGDTAANAGILTLLSSNPFLSKLPSPMKTAFASVAGALFRMVLVPGEFTLFGVTCSYSRRLETVDTLKTTMQTQGSNGLKILKDRIKAYGIGTLWVSRS